MDEIDSFASAMIQSFMDSVRLMVATGHPNKGSLMVLSCLTSFIAAISPEARQEFLLKLNKVIDIIGNEAYEDVEDVITALKENLKEEKNGTEQ